MYHTSTKHIYICMQSAHVGPSRTRMVAITHLLLLDRCGYYVDKTYEILSIRYMYVSYINKAYASTSIYAICSCRSHTGKEGYFCSSPAAGSVRPLRRWYIPYFIHTVYICITYQHNIYICMQPAHVGPSRAKMVAAAPLLDRCDFHVYIYIYVIENIHTHTRTTRMYVWFVCIFLLLLLLDRRDSYVYMYDTKHTHAHTHTHTYTPVGWTKAQQAYTDSNMCICIYVYMCICVYVYMYGY